MTTKDKLKSLTKNLEFLLQAFCPVTDIQVLSNSYPQTLRVVSQQNQVKEGKKLMVSNHFVFDPKNTSSPLSKLPLFPTAEPTITAEEISPSKKLRAVVRKEGEKSVLEIWSNNSLYRTLNITDQHGPLFDDATTTIRTLSWSANENRVLYLAEQKKDKKPKYFEELKSDEDAKKALENFEFNDDFGEVLNPKYNPVAFLYDITEDALYQVKNVPEAITPLQVSFADKEGNSLLFTGLKKDIFKTGLLFCFNRDTSIYYSSKIVLKRLTNTNPDGKKKEEAEIKAEEEALKQEISANVPVRVVEDDIAVFPLLNQDFSRIAYYFSPKNFAHAFTLGLKVIDINSDFPSKPKITSVLEIPEEKDPKFAGICGYHDTLRKSAWLSSRFFAFTSNIEHAVGIFIVDVETKEIVRIDTPKYKSETWSIVNSNNGVLYATINNLEGPNKFAIYEGLNLSEKSLSDAVKSAKWTTFEFDVKSDSFLNREETYKKLLDIGEVHEEIFEEKGCQSVFISLKSKDENAIKDKDKALIHLLHGGPHGTMGLPFSYMVQYLLPRGYNFLVTNFSGSLGFGQKFASGCVGKCGEVDIDEVKAHLDLVVKKELCHPEKLAIFGGSYSGYQIGVFVSRYPDLYRVAVNRNPVLDIIFTEKTSDIPEWGHCEYLSRDFTFDWSIDDIKKAIEMSPTYMKNEGIKTSMLLMVGGKDKRVPPQQSVFYYKMMKSKGFDITFRYYPEFGHGLRGALEGEFDILVNQLTYLESKIQTV